MRIRRFFYLFILILASNSGAANPHLGHKAQLELSRMHDWTKSEGRSMPQVQPHFSSSYLSQLEFVKGKDRQRCLEKSNRIDSVIMRKGYDISSDLRKEKLTLACQLEALFRSDAEIIEELKWFGSSYIHGVEAEFPYDIQLYQNGNFVVIFSSPEDTVKVGGYKNFYYAVEMRSEKLVASLTAHFRKKDHLDSLFRELKALISLRSVSGVLHLFGFGPKMEQGRKKNISFQTELADITLKDYLKARKTPENSARLLAATAKTLDEVHAKGWVHRDINGKNMMIIQSGSFDSVVIKLGDFGLSEFKKSSDFLKHLSGTRGYMDPFFTEKRILGRGNFSHESTKFQNVFRGYYKMKEVWLSEVFSLGITYAQLLFPQKFKKLSQLVYDCNLTVMPSKNHTEHQKSYFFKDYDRIYHSQKKSMGHTSKLEKLIWKMIEPEPSKRPSLNKVARLAKKVYK